MFGERIMWFEDAFCN